MANQKTAPFPDSPAGAEFRDWHAERRVACDALGRAVVAILEGLLKAEKIDFLSINHRVKALESALEKIQRKDYRDPRNEMHDLLGIRVIAFIETDVKRISELVERTFNVHPGKSTDKNQELGADRMGYRSIHYVCDLGEARGRLPEFAGQRELLFEIQIRTVLQHAWAEIEHDRKYKFAGVLPAEIERRLNLLAGVLELADREFANLAARVDDYHRELDAGRDQFPLDIEVTSDSLARYHERKRAVFEAHGIRIERLVVSGSVVYELKDFGVSTLRQLDGLLGPDFFSAIKAAGGRVTTLSGLLRDAMIYADLDRYFGTAWKRRWGYASESDLDLFRGKWGAPRVAEALRRSSITVVKRH